MSSQTGVLLVNLGTPNSPSDRDVYRYLIEFLTDPRVIDFPWIQRQLLVRGMIVPKRYKQTAAAYRQIWTPDGSPLIIYGKYCQRALNDSLGSNCVVELAMRYQNPSIKEGLKKLLIKGVNHLIILPLFPHYASATTGSVFQCIMDELRHSHQIPKLTLIHQFATHPLMIQAFCSLARQHPLSFYDHFLFSFHGLPERQIKKSDRSSCCLTKSTCCRLPDEKNQHCYKAQCHATAEAIAKELRFSSEQFTICFQSRLGKEPWLQPYTNETIINLAKRGKKRLLVFCPSFVCDCLETLYEIGIEYRKEYLHFGGEQLDLVSGLNDHPLWIESLADLVKSHIPKEMSCL